MTKHDPDLDGGLLRHDRVTHVLPLGGNMVTKRRMPLSFHLWCWYMEATGWLMRALRLCKHQGGGMCSSVDWITRCGRCRAPLPPNMQMCGAVREP